jgi:hypothetical protein
MECIFCKSIFESEEEKKAKKFEESRKGRRTELENRKKAIIAEMEKFANLNKEKAVDAQKRNLDNINQKIEDLETKEIIIVDKLCPKCEAIIGKIIEDKLEEKMGDIVERIKDSVIIGIN